MNGVTLEGVWVAAAVVGAAVGFGVFIVGAALKRQGVMRVAGAIAIGGVLALPIVVFACVLAPATLIMWLYDRAENAS